MHRRVSLFNNNAEAEVYLKGVEPKVIHTFQTAGEYILEIRDITSRFGNSDYAYRVLVRPQIPHVGEISSPGMDRINLVRGKTYKLLLTTFLEEGFGGEAAFGLSALPPGVSALSTGQTTTTDRAPTDVGENTDAVLPASVTTSITLLASDEAAVSSSPIPSPVMVQLYCRPVVNGAPGSSLMVRSIPLMVVADPPLREKQQP